MAGRIGMMAENFGGILGEAASYYGGKIREHGPVPRGVDWNGPDSQELRFSQLLKCCGDMRAVFSINDYGCGYGGLRAYILSHGYRDFRYVGFDVSEEMVSEAKRQLKDAGDCELFVGSTPKEPADYSVASGIFNVRQQRPDAEWLEYILDTIAGMNKMSRRAFAFNCLTKYSDAEYMRDYLYYADPCFLFDFCKRNFSRNVALLHDYGLYEFTIIVRKDS